MYKKEFMLEAIEMSKKCLSTGKGGPFGAVIVKNGEIIGRGSNQVTLNNDPTAHAEVVAIRDACKNLNDFQLTDCEIYTSCEPCPMCLGAIYWARPAKLYYAANKDDASDAGFDDSFIYEEIDLPYDKRKIKMEQYEQEEAVKVFDSWKKLSNKVDY
ncbi:MAG TPA: nucleoside deaminase [Bacteroidales bacterium]|jgi:guanine deaminase|nr:nucleoside deaminase [Bacteroidales bacterium]HOF46388.1 nucleoside deaminase [Bacteroidales bacterium]HOS57367.1 nucleoside deaminase [Bacteroidales bacterium]HPY80606.1 nucleoside deaminase [Bacteroidales bacterium]HQA86942.1 nucleoside deaminase [Bacteroidales bacterium]